MLGSRNKANHGGGPENGNRLAQRDGHDARSRAGSRRHQEARSSGCPGVGERDRVTSAQREARCFWIKMDYTCFQSGSPR